MFLTAEISTSLRKDIYKSYTCLFISSFTLSSSPLAGLAGRLKSTKAVKDTSSVNRHITKALEYAYHSKNTDAVKVHIDSAEAICIEENIEFPTLLHLAGPNISI